MVSAGGIRHLTFDWSDDHELEIEGTPIPERRDGRAPRLDGTGGGGEDRAVVVVGASDLVVRVAERRFERLAARARGGSSAMARRVLLEVDADGLPIWPGPANAWPLELDDDA